MVFSDLEAKEGWGGGSPTHPEAHLLPLHIYSPEGKRFAAGQVKRYNPNQNQQSCIPTSKLQPNQASDLKNPTEL